MGTNGRGGDALADLAAAVGEADRGGSLYETANALARVVVERADADEALRMLSAVRPRT